MFTNTGKTCHYYYILPLTSKLIKTRNYVCTFPNALVELPFDRIAGGFVYKEGQRYPLRSCVIARCDRCVVDYTTFIECSVKTRFDTHHSYTCKKEQKRRSPTADTAAGVTYSHIQMNIRCWKKEKGQNGYATEN